MTGTDEQAQDQDTEFDLVQIISGAMVRFNEFGHVLDISLPMDFSLALLTGLPLGLTVDAIVDMVRGFGFKISADCVRISGSPTLGQTATLKVKDSLFARSLSDRLKDQGSTIRAVSMPMNTRQTRCQKVHVSWHKATRTVWLNFKNGESAHRVSRRFNDSTYRCLGQAVKSSPPKRSGNWRSVSHNSVAWTVTLSGVPGQMTCEDLQDTITSAMDKPKHVEMGAISHTASEAEVSVVVRSRLEEYGPLESFFFVSATEGKRAKVTAQFQDELEARSACSLNNTTLGILGKGKITVTMVQSAKIKVLSRVYSILRPTIEEKMKGWQQHNVMLHVYPDTLQPFTTLRVEGIDAKEVAAARRALDDVLNGIILTDGENALWSPAFNINGIAYQKLKGIERELQVVIMRENSKRQLRFYGSAEKIRQVVRRINSMLDNDSSSSYEIGLSSQSFDWAMFGGLKEIERATEKNIAILDVVSRNIVIKGTARQYDAALAVINSRSSRQGHPIVQHQPQNKDGCPICFCEAESPIQTSCSHTYCLECLEGYCDSTASTSQEEFQIKCCGAEGACSAVFTLSELKTYISSFMFYQVLQKSFEEYVKRHPDDFRPCPTADCGHIYRCSTHSGLQTLSYTCPNCFEPLCRSCHAQHGAYTCAEYKDIASGGVRALEKLKKELNVKDCPRCKTSMEKTMGCNHLTCGGCRAHICWVCMSVFETAAPCYTHMNKEHGGIGLDLERFMD